MKTISKIFCLIFLIIFTLTAKSQVQNPSQDFKLYYIQLEGFSGEEEQAKYLAKLISQTESVLFTTVNTSGFTRLVAIDEVDLNSIIEKIQVIKSLSISNMHSVTFSKDEYLSIYYERLNVNKNDISKTAPIAIKMGDKTKQEISHKFATLFWEELYLNK